VMRGKRPHQGSSCFNDTEVFPASWKMYERAERCVRSVVEVPVVVCRAGTTAETPWRRRRPWSSTEQRATLPAHISQVSLLAARPLRLSVHVLLRHGRCYAHGLWRVYHQSRAW
jgi:hypothetical protein